MTPSKAFLHCRGLSPWLLTLTALAWPGTGTAAGANEPATIAAQAGSAHHAPAKSRRKAAAQRKARPSPDGPAYGRRPDAMALADSLAAAHGLDPAWARAQVAQARYQASVTRLVMPPAAGTAKNWAAYRARFVEPDRIQAGVAFWAAQARWLDQAEQRYGVPAAIVVGIIGVETFYGRLTGSYRVLDALATLSLDFPTGRSDRSAFFRDELGQLLKLAHQEGVPPASLKGSFAGAMGLGQFMPGSINRFAVDFDGNGHIDMAGGVGMPNGDVIGSVAHYLARHGWQAGQATHYSVLVPADSEALARLLEPDILPSFSPAQMVEAGAGLAPDALAHQGPLALVALQNSDAPPSYVAGTQNFYAVTRYNWSSYYALAVIELGQAVAEARLQGAPLR